MRRKVESVGCRTTQKYLFEQTHNRPRRPLPACCWELAGRGFSPRRVFDRSKT